MARGVGRQLPPLLPGFRRRCPCGPIESRRPSPHSALLGARDLNAGYLVAATSSPAEFGVIRDRVTPSSDCDAPPWGGAIPRSYVTWAWHATHSRPPRPPPPLSLTPTVYPLASRPSSRHATSLRHTDTYATAVRCHPVTPRSALARIEAKRGKASSGGSALPARGELARREVCRNKWHWHDLLGGRGQGAEERGEGGYMTGSSLPHGNELAGCY